jgi:hypothetical protein
VEELKNAKHEALKDEIYRKRDELDALENDYAQGKGGKRKLTKRERRQEFIDDILLRYRKSLMALKFVRWECERIVGK